MNYELRIIIVSILNMFKVFVQKKAACLHRWAAPFY